MPLTYFKKFFKISALIFGFTLISCHNNAHLRTQKLLKPGEKVISANTTILIGGESDENENGTISQQPNGVLGGRGELSFLFGGQNSEYGPYLAYGFNGGLGYIYPGVALGYGTKKYIKLKSENWWKVGGDIELDITPLGKTVHFLPTIIKSTDLYNPIYLGIHGIYTYGNKLKQNDYYRYETKTQIGASSPWNLETFLHETHEYDQEYIYNINTTGFGLTLGYEDLAIKDQSFQFQVNISLVKNTVSSNSIPPDISDIPDVSYISWRALPNQNDFHPVISCNIGINSFEGIRGLFDKKEKTFYNPNTGDRINNIFSDKSKKNIFKLATLISNGAFLGLAAGVYLGIIDP